MLVGEPGIGKTRLAQRAGEYAVLRGAQVLFGHCHETEAGIPYLPFVDAIRQVVARIVSEVTQRLPEIQPAPPGDPEGDRHRLCG